MGWPTDTALAVAAVLVMDVLFVSEFIAVGALQWGAFMPDLDGR